MSNLIQNVSSHRLVAYKALAFILRDFRVESSYKVGLFFEFAASSVPVFSAYFIGKFIGRSGHVNAALNRYGGDYFSFALVGIALAQYYVVALDSFAAQVRRSQLAGCLEAVLGTQTSPSAVIVMSASYSFLSKTFHILLVFIISAFFLNVRFTSANVPGALLVLFLMIISSSAIGIFSAAAIVVLKKGDPFEWLMGSVGALLAGTLYPTTMFPVWLQHVAALLPITHAVEAMRLCILKGATLETIWRPLAVLAVFSLILFPFSIWCFSRAVEKCRRDGTLMGH